MINKPYHHGDLRNQLIETGIKLLSEEGVKDFSLRKVAANCGVSHTAPYSHFKNIEELSQAMGDYVTQKFIKKLRDSVEGIDDSSAAILMLGESYISFFSENPYYYQFLFYNSGITFDFDHGIESDYQPFNFFKDTAYRMFNDIGLAKEDYLNNLLALWSIVHGIVSLLTNKGVQYSGDWKKVLTDNIFMNRGKKY